MDGKRVSRPTEKVLAMAAVGPKSKQKHTGQAMCTAAPKRRRMDVDNDTSVDMDASAVGAIEEPNDIIDMTGSDLENRAEERQNSEDELGGL